MNHINRIMMIAPTAGGKSTLLKRLMSMSLFKERKAIALDGDNMGYRNDRDEWMIPGSTIMLFSHEVQIPFIVGVMCANLREVTLSWDGIFLWLDNYDAETLFQLSHKRAEEGKNTYTHVDVAHAQKNIDYFNRIKDVVFEKKTKCNQIVIDMAKYLNEEETLTQLLCDILLHDVSKDSIWSEL